MHKSVHSPLRVSGIDRNVHLDSNTNLLEFDGQGDLTKLLDILYPTGHRQHHCCIIMLSQNTCRRGNDNHIWSDTDLTLIFAAHHETGLIV